MMDEQQQAVIKAVGEQFENIAAILSVYEPARESALAMDKLTECMGWVNVLVMHGVKRQPKVEEVQQMHVDVENDVVDAA